MKLLDFIRKLDYLNIDKECDNPSTIDCVAYIPRRKTTVVYPITSITVISTHKSTKIILNAEREAFKEINCIKLNQLYEDLKELQYSLDDYEKRRSYIFMSIKKNKNAPKICHTIPKWSWPILDNDQEALFIKSTNSFVLYKD